MERIRRYLERTSTSENAEQSSTTVGLYYGRLYDAKSIGSLSQRFFESDEDERYYGTCNGYTSQPGSKSNLLLCSECDQKTHTCTYRPRTPGSYVDRYVEERLDPTGNETALLRADRKTPPSTRSSPRSSPRSFLDRRDRPPSTPTPTPTPTPTQTPTPTPTSLRDIERIIPRGSSSPAEYRLDEAREETRVETSKKVSEHRRFRVADDDDDDDDDENDDENDDEDNEDDEDEDDDDDDDDEDSPGCDLCRGNGLVLVRCEHCNFSTEGDLICFRCQSDEGSSTNENNGCPRCERTGRIGIDQETAALGKYPVDALVKIKLNDRTMDVVDSDDTNDSDPSIGRQRGQVDRLDTIIETKGDTTASENDEENGASAKLNGTTPARFLNYMIVLFL